MTDATRPVRAPTARRDNSRIGPGPRRTGGTAIRDTPAERPDDALRTP